MKELYIKKFLAILILCALAFSIFACDNTGAETEAPSGDVENDTGNTDSSDDSESGDESGSDGTECEHPYASDENGHWKPACDVCGKPEGSSQAHEVAEKIKDRGDRLAYIYYCVLCDYVVFKQELSYDINVYIPPTDLAAVNCYNLTGTYFFEDGVGFTRFTSSGSGAYIRAYEDTACEDVSGRYLIMKARLNGGSSMALRIKSNQAQSSVTVTACELDGDWATLIIDLAAVGNGTTTGYVPDGGGDYYLEELRIYFDNNTLLPAGGYADISYITVVETKEDAYELVGEGNRLYLYDNIAMNPFPTIEGASCEHSYVYNESTHSMSACAACGAEATVDVPHSVKERVFDGTYTYACDCGYTFDTSKVVSSDINTFLSPSFIAKHADNSAIWSGGELLYEEGGEPFARIYGKTADASGKRITDDKKIWNVYANGVSVTGQYLVIKYRIPNNALIASSDNTSSFTQSQIRIYTSTQRTGATDEKDGLYLPVSEDDKWHVAIINLAFSVGNSGGGSYVAAEDGTYTMKFMQMRLFYGALSSESDYTDIAYIGFCDKLEEAVSLVEEDEYYWQCKKGERTGYTVKKSEGPNPEDEIPEGTTPDPDPEPVVKHVIEESFKDGVYSYSCSHCEAEIGSIAVPDTVNKFYSPNYLSTVSGYNSIKNLVIDSDGTLFTRITGNNGTAFEYDLVNRSGSPATDAGAFRYVVMRIRVSNATKHLNFVFQMENVDTSVRINNSMTNGEWVTLVLDMDKIAKITPNGDGGYKISHCRFYPQDLGADYVDISYIALCDSWEEVAPLAIDDKVTLVTHTDNAGGKVNAADGSCADHAPTETVSGSTYTYACANCGTTLLTKTVSAETNLFLSANSLNSTYAANHELKYEDGIVFKRFTTTAGGAHIYIRNSATLADAGKYLVMKLRASAEMTSFVLGAGADSISNIEQNPPHDRGAWRTVVIDLAQFTNYKVDAENGNVQIQFTIYGNNPGYTLDVAYVAIVDDRNEARAIIDDETYQYYSSWKVKPVVVETDMENCDTCLVTETKNGNTYSYSDCAICSRSFAGMSKTVSEDITKYYSASALASCTGYNSSRVLAADESGEAFARVTSNDGGAFHFYIVNMSGAPTTDLGEAVRYVTFKVRMSDINQEYTFSLLTKDGKGTNLTLHTQVTKADEWVTIVFDMDAIAALEANSDGTYTLKQFYAFTSATGTNTLDIACVAFCNTWEEIASASGDAEAILVTQTNIKGTLVSTLDGSAK